MVEEADTNLYQETLSIMSCQTSFKCDAVGMDGGLLITDSASIEMSDTEKVVYQCQVGNVGLLVLVL